MKNNILIKILCSIPVILVFLYFIPFLGICLILFRYYAYHNKKYYITSIWLLIVSLLLLIPKLLDSIIKTFKLNNIEIPYLNSIITSNIYTKLLSYSKLLIIVGVISLILTFIFKNIFNKISSKINSGMRSYVEHDLRKDYEIRKENDLIMQEKREKAKNTHAVKCPYCGSTNLLTEQTGICKFCRRYLEYK